MHELISFPAFLYCTPRLRIAIAIAIAQCIPSGKGYSLAVTDPNQDADLSFSDLFEIETPSYACLDGTFDEDDGKEPGCKQCEKGKYSLNTTFCTDCEAGKTTEDRGAANSTFCDVDEVYEVYTVTSVQLVNDMQEGRKEEGQEGKEGQERLCVI